MVQVHCKPGPPRQPLPDWPQGIRKETSSVNKNIPRQVNNPETPVEPTNSKSLQRIIINDAKTISEEVVNNIEYNGID